MLRVWDVNDGSLLDARTVTESAPQTQGTTALYISTPALTAAGATIVSSYYTPTFESSSTVGVYEVCSDCFDPAALRSDAAARLREIAPISAR